MTQIITEAYLILARTYTPESDILLRAYGQAGQINVFVPSDLNLSAGLFEPANLIWMEFKQSGDWVILRDLKKVEMLSLIAFGDYEQYIWMCYILNFIRRWFFHFDRALFELIIEHLKKRVENFSIDSLRFELETLKVLGLYGKKSMPSSIKSEIDMIESGKLSNISTKIANEIRDYIYYQLSSLE